ncbi:cell wall hydrolase [Altererythrobacter ishigakiensis]|uniref:Cell wall hydrolase n=1 Tax=Altererythrobacter ishigakiensis TaxID=476157 RepID=A0A562USX5_9SPHN|nr:cell wall hydrolase [Altererythrobacter ishigakiensis]TWJ08697.1 cell wall hydrolase [Altererythrobacter ishigakiensis]
MTRRSHGLGAATTVVALGLTFASAEMSGAAAQVAEPEAVVAQAATADAKTASEPVFVSQEVVQPVADDSNAGDAQPGDASNLRELVSQTDTDFALSEQMRCLAGAVYFESRGEPLAGQLAVAQVVINRAESSRFPSSYCGVVYQRAQFSFVRGGAMPLINKGSAAWDRAKAIARIAHEGLWESEAADSLYFHAKYVNPSWNRKMIARATINQHIFYR